LITTYCCLSESVAGQPILALVDPASDPSMMMQAFRTVRLPDGHARLGMAGNAFVLKALW
jgi:hypothetical protein